MTKTCSTCNESRGLDQFRKGRNTCKPCISAYDKVKREARKSRDLISKERCCSSCKSLKAISEFNVGQMHCKKCRLEYRLKNKDKLREKNKRYQQENRATIVEKKREYYLRNKHTWSEKAKVYRETNKQIITERKRSYYQRNKKKIHEKVKGKLASDTLFAMSARLRNLIGVSLRSRNYKKTSRTAKLLGADFTTVMSHLIQTAINNYGEYDPKERYHIDHIIPCASAKTEEELISLQHYTNLQYLLPVDNLRKNDRLDWCLTCQA